MSEENYLALRRTNDLLRTKMSRVKEKTDQLATAIVSRNLYEAKRAAALLDIALRQARETACELQTLVATELSEQMPEHVPWVAPQRRNEG